MWRTLNNLSRAFRSHLFNPRPSAGVIVDEEQDNTHNNEPADQDICNCHELEDYTQHCGRKDVKSSARDGPRSDRDDQFGKKDGHNSSDEDDNMDWHNSYNYFHHLLHGSRNVFEAVTWGPAVLWGTETDRHKKKSRLLYRVLFALSGNDLTSADKLGRSTDKTQYGDLRPLPQPLAIKDAKGSADDQEVNISMTETLEAAVKQFELATHKYAASCEGLLGLKAAEACDMSTAVQHMHRSCRLGNVSACFNLGLCYETGSGVPQDNAKAIHYYRKAARRGHSMALYNLGLLCMREKVDSNSTRSSRGSKMTALDKETGLEMLEEAAQRGLSQAQTYMGLHHINKTREPSKAFSYFKAAADQNDHDAQYYLAMCYEQGLGVETNECVAARLYSQAAQAGHDLALYNLAVFNEEGLGGLPKNEAEAVKMYQKAADLGIWQAKERLGEIQAFSAHQEADCLEKKENSTSCLVESATDQENLTLTPTLSASTSTTEPPFTSQLSPSPSLPSLETLMSLAPFTPPHKESPVFTASLHREGKFILREQPDPTRVKGQGLLTKVSSFLGLFTPTAAPLRQNFAARPEGFHPYLYEPLSFNFVQPAPTVPGGIHKSQTFSEFSMIGI